jgi:hypothetical protein
MGLGLAKAQRVSPYQSGSYYPGLINLRDLTAPPAGIILLDYNYWFGSDGYNDKDGNEFLLVFKNAYIYNTLLFKEITLFNNEFDGYEDYP